MSDNKKEWYVVNTYAGHENRVKENLEKRIESMGISDYLFKVVVAEETQTEIRRVPDLQTSQRPAHHLCA